MLITIRNASPNDLPPGTVELLDDGQIKVDCTIAELTEWISHQSVKMRNELTDAMIEAVRNGDIKL